MEATSAPASAPMPVKPGRRWLRGVLLFLALVFLIAAGAWLYFDHWTRIDWDTAEAETDRLDPRWRLAELQADRPVVADDDNAALLIVAAADKLDRTQLFVSPNYELALGSWPPNARLNWQQLQLIEADFAKMPEMHEVAHKLKKRPNGRFTLEYADDFHSTTAHLQKMTRQVAAWLELDALIRADAGQAHEALESHSAMLNIARIPGREWTFFAYLIQSHIQIRSIASLERTLALGTVDEARLKTVQTRIQNEAGESSWLHALRGERAGLHHLYSQVRRGAWNHSAIVANGNPGDIAGWMQEKFPAVALPSFPDALRSYNEAIEIGKLPIHEQAHKLDAWAAKARASSNPVLRQFTPELERVHKANCANQGVLRSAVVAVACERFRLRNKAWPESLDALVKEKLLETAPTDPIDNQPLRFRKTKDLIVIYSIGNDGVDNQGQLDHSNAHPAGSDVGFRLWDIEARRQPPLPPVVAPEEDR